MHATLNATWILNVSVCIVIFFGVREVFDRIRKRPVK